MKLVLPITAALLSLLPDALAVVCRIEVQFDGKILASKLGAPGVLKHIGGYWCLAGQNCLSPNCGFGDDQHLFVRARKVKPSRITAEELAQAAVPDTGTEHMSYPAGSYPPSAPSAPDRW
ncbi:hypothetical protein MCOR27_006873 [Pyricularia oryzae]|nr:hypothetical protein MCOR01_006613 [Pyricularia oryzae]KAI6263181.1 hypothetical protein MCOR19_000669 [Pyricularia oryzae]KAI6275650.1 hypothetical protein MCOR27_006873 [Pyricularia oryzae]KAI6285033.1 hypothetical protein MCOR26_001733 [Pyricularia oryzae]KAI6364137.1 hypothetical protein MCOR31_012111 [Pyricularia oryzae]